MSKETALGLEIENIIVNGSGYDTDHRRVSADAIAETNDSRRWFLSLVTKVQYLSDGVSVAFEEVEDPATHISAFEEGLTRVEPYVLNDREISDEVLEAKFLGRRVDPALAEAMIYAGVLSDSD